MERSKLRIVIPTFNRKECLYDLLSSLFKLDTKIFNLCIVVIVDGSTDGTNEMLENFKDKIYIIQGNGSYWWTKCVNTGLAFKLKFNVEYYLLLNDDTVLPNNFFIELEKVIQRYPNSLIQTAAKDIKTKQYFDLGAIVSKKNPFKIRRFIDDFTVGEEIKQYQEVNYLHGRGMIIPSDIIRKIGLLDEKCFPQYFSDSDFALRAHKAGFQLIVSRDCFIYVHSEKTGRTVYESTYSWGNFFKRLYKLNSPSNIKYLVKYNFRHVPKLLFFPFTVIKINIILIGYLKRWNRFKKNEK